MITIKEDQWLKISTAMENLFLVRASDLLNIENIKIWEDMQDEEKKLFLIKSIAKAKTISLTIEKDIYDFLALSLLYGEDFHLADDLMIDHEWIHSENVPGCIKIQKLNSSIQIKLNKREPQHAR